MFLCSPMLIQTVNPLLNTPIHAAARDGFGCPAIILTQLAHEFPAALKMPNEHGHLPLHCSVESSFIALETVNFLLDEYPEAAQHRSSRSGQLPIHVACAHHTPTQVLDILNEKYPDGQFVYDNDGHLPFHVACVRGSVDTIEYWIHHMDGPNLPPTKNGTHPLFLACENNQGLDVLWKLVQHSQELFTGSISLNSNPNLKQGLSSSRKKRRV